MAIQSKPMPRAFKYEATLIADPAPRSSPSEALRILALSYPKFNNAAVDGPFIEDGKSIWQIKVATGTKG